MLRMSGIKKEEIHQEKKMKKQNLYIAMFVIGALMFVALSCKSLVGGSKYSSVVDKFSIAFPSGGEDVKMKTEKVKYAASARSYSKSLDNRSDNFRIYEVQVADMDGYNMSGKTPREVLVIALNGWEKESGTQIKDITVNNQNGIDSLRTVIMGKVSLTFREVVFWSEANKKLYLLRIATTNKDKVATPEADAFINSFKLTA